MTNQDNDPNRPETEEDSVIVMERRRFRALPGWRDRQGQTPASSPSPSNTPPTTEPESSQEQTEEQEAYSRMSELLKRRREG